MTPDALTRRVQALEGDVRELRRLLERVVALLERSLGEAPHGVQPTDTVQ